LEELGEGINFICGKASTAPRPEHILENQEVSYYTTFPNSRSSLNTRGVGTTT